MKLNAAEVRVLKMWSCKSKFAIRDSKRGDIERAPRTQNGLSIPSGGQSGANQAALRSLAELGLLNRRAALGYFGITDAGVAECRVRWPEEATNENV